jgi:hypothetical protein
MILSALVAAGYMVGSVAFDLLMRESHTGASLVGVTAAVVALASGFLAVVAKRWTLYLLLSLIAVTVLGIASFVLIGLGFSRDGGGFTRDVLLFLAVSVAFPAPLLILMWRNYRGAEQRYRESTGRGHAA